MEEDVNRTESNDTKARKMSFSSATLAKKNKYNQTRGEKEEKRRETEE